ncbi:MAG: hypothetical protein ACPG6V_07665 [Flavobacteriales bacterium]
MKYLVLIVLTSVFSSQLSAQYYTESQIETINNNESANEGDLYLDTVNNIQYIGITSGHLVTVGNDVYSADGQLLSNRNLDGNQKNLNLVNLDSSKIESTTIEFEGNVILNNVSETTTNTKNLVVDANGRMFTRPETQAQSDIILIDPNPVTITGSGDQVIHDVTIPGGTLGTKNVIRVSLFMRRTSGNSSIRLKVFYGGDLVAQMPGFNGNNPAKSEIILFGAGTTNSQRAYIYHSNSGASGLGTSSTNNDSTTPLTMSIRGDLNNDGHSWVCDFIMVEVIR